jgi:hypothetical protein
MVPVPVLPILAASALCSFALAALLLVAGVGSRPLAAHLAFAFGIMPLILGAMSYFIPVLTRGPSSPLASGLPPLLAAIGGGLALLAFHGGFGVTPLAAATIGLVAALALAAWAAFRVRAMVGRRHPGLDWYFAALGFLVAALIAVALMELFPAYRAAWRQFHLHANLLGFVGLTALGTLQVLLPTCMGQVDPEAFQRLRRDLKWAASGTALVAAGSGLVSLGTPGSGAAAVIGALLWQLVVLRMAFGWWQRYRRAMLAVDSAAASLGAAAVGLCGLLLAGILHGGGLLNGRAAIVAFVVGFLLPLVSGAAAYLLPVWIRPGAQGEWHRGLRARLCRRSGWRAAAFLAVGALLVLG